MTPPVEPCALINAVRPSGAICRYPGFGPVGTVVALAPIAALGRISYGAYLYHWPLYLVLDEARTGLDGWSLVAVRIGVTLVREVSCFARAPTRRRLPLASWGGGFVHGPRGATPPRRGACPDFCV